MAGHAPGKDVNVAPVFVNISCPLTFYKHLLGMEADNKTMANLIETRGRKA